MYSEKIRRLENVFADQTTKIDLLKNDASKAMELKTLIEQRSNTLTELSKLRRLQYEEHERVRFDDDR
jgi:small-conductance mechanosensitive channel